MKNISRILTIAGLSAVLLSSAAQAYDNAYPMSPERQRIHDREAYWIGKTSGGTGVVTQNPDYVHLVTPQQRMAARSDAYFKSIGYKGGEVKPFNRYTDVSEYPFNCSVLSAERGGYVFSSAAC